MCDNVVKEGSFVTIQSFMVTELKLKGNELLIYAIIFGFSQDEETHFKGSLRYLAEWTNSTKQGVVKCLKALVEKGLIRKKEYKDRGVNKVEYYTTKFNGGIQQSLTPIQQSLIPPIQQSLPDNIDIHNIDDNINNNIESIESMETMGGTTVEKIPPTPPLSSQSSDETPKRTRFVPPTVEEVREYCEERNSIVNPEKFCAYYESVGWVVGGKTKMQNWKKAIVTWELREKEKGVAVPSREAEPTIRREDLPVYEDLPDLPF